MINKRFWRLGLLIASVILSLYPVMAAGIPKTSPDIVFVRIPAAAKPASPSIKSRIPADRYVDGCQIVRFSLSGSRKNVIHLTPEFLSACDPAVSFDGRKILFAGKRKKGDRWQIWRMDGSGGNKIQITHGSSDSVSPLYVGSLFHLDDKSPTRKILYVSSGHLYTCDLDGKNPRRITYNPYPEFGPDVLPNGRVVFSSLKSSGLETEAGKTLDLLAVNIDGTDLMGYLTGFDLPGDKEMVGIAPDGRVYFIQSDLSRWLGGGALACVSSRRPGHSYKLLASCEDGYFHSPCPLPGGSLIVSYRSKQEGALYSLRLIKVAEMGRGPTCVGNFPQMKVGNWDRRTASTSLGAVFSQTSTSAAGSNDYHCVDAQVLGSHPVVKGRSSFEDFSRDTGVFYCISAYISDRPEVQQLARGAIKRVRVLAGISLDQKPEVSLRILGTAPVEPDGSFHIRVPAETPLIFQLLDKENNVITSQRSWTWVMPRESRGCIGCHENRELAPPNRFPQAVIKPAVKLTRKREQR